MPTAVAKHGHRCASPENSSRSEIILMLGRAAMMTRATSDLVQDDLSGRDCASTVERPNRCRNDSRLGRYVAHGKDKCPSSDGAVENEDSFEKLTIANGRSFQSEARWLTVC